MAEGYYHTKASVEEYIRLAEDVSGADLIKKLDPFLQAQSSVLELGTGPGTDWQLLDKRYKVTGSDLSLEFLSHLRNSVPEGKFIELDAITIDTEQRFDAVYSNKVLHHLKDEELIQSINRQSEVLNEGGIICHSFWKGEGSEIFKGLFVNYHTESALTDVFSSRFDIELIEPYAEFERGDSILLIARKKP